MTQQPAPPPSGVPPTPYQPYPAQPQQYPSYPPAVPPPPPSGRWQPERVDHLPGTEFGLVQLRVEPISSGLATGALIAGIGTILISTLVLCIGLAGGSGWVAGAFTVLCVVGGGGSVALGLVARRQIRNSGRVGQVRFTGRGLAIAGISCGAVGAGIALVGLVLALVLQLSS